MIKSITFCFLSLLMIAYGTTTIAQSLAVSVSGTRCPGSILTCYSNIPPAKIVWKQGSTVVQADSAVWQPNAFTTVGVTDTPGATGAYLHGPNAVFVDKHGNIYVADKLNARIQKRTDSIIITVAGTGTAGSSAKQLNNPSGIFVDTAGNIYIADAGNNRIQKWKQGDTIGTTVAGSSSGSSGSTASLLNNPAAVFRDATGNLYIADAGNNRIQKWASGASSGSTVAGSSSGSSGSTASLLNNPSGLFLDASGNIYIADGGNNRIQKWTSGASSGTTVAGSSSGTAGSTVSLLNSPTSVWLDGLGYLYICDANNNRIQRWYSGAPSGITIGGNSSGASGNTSSLLNAPKGIALDAGNNVYVADYNNQRVQKFIDTIRNTFVPADTGIYTAVVTTFSNNTASINDTITRTVTPSFQIGSPNSVKSPKIMVAICPNSKSLNFFVNPPVNGGSSPSFQWQVNGTVVATTGLSTPFIDTDFHRGDSVSCIMTSSLSCASPATVQSSNTLHLDTLHAYTPSVTISDIDHGHFCYGAPDTFIATASGYSNTPTFIWKVNGDTVGTNSSKLYTGGITSVSLLSKDTVSCIIVSLDGCALPRDTASNSIGVYVTPLHPPLLGNIFSISGDTLCAKVNVGLFTARPLGYSLPPSYQWTKNGKNIIGAVKDTLRLLPDSMVNGDKIECVFISNDLCPISKTTLSNTDTLHLLSHVRPSVTITDSPTAVLTPRTTVTFTAHPINGGKHPSYIWYKNTHKISGVDTDIYVTNDVAVGDIISCILFSDAQCLDTFAARSNSLTIRNNTAVAQVGNAIQDINLYPNPNNGNFILHAQLQSNTGYATVQMINTIGYEVFRQEIPIQKGVLNSNLHISNVPPGIYLLRLSNSASVANLRIEILK